MEGALRTELCCLGGEIVFVFGNFVEAIFYFE